MGDFDIPQAKLDALLHSQAQDEINIGTLANRITLLEKQQMLNNAAIGLLQSQIIVGAPPPPPVGYQVNSPHLIHQRKQWTDFGVQYKFANGQLGTTPVPPAVQAEADVIAARTDRIMSGQRRFWSANPTISWGGYVLIWKPVVPGLNGTAVASQQTAFAGSNTDPSSHMKTYADANGYDVENMVLHYRDGQVKFESTKPIVAIAAGSPATIRITSHGYLTGDRVQLSLTAAAITATGLTSKLYNSGVIVMDADNFTVPDTATGSEPIATGVTYGTASNKIGDGTKLFGNRKLYRVGTFGVRYLMEPNEPHQGAYHGFRLGPSFAISDYLFIDESESFSFKANVLDSLEYNMAGLTTVQQDAQVQLYYDRINIVQAGIRAANGNKVMQINSASYYTQLDRQMARGGGGAQHELSPNLTNGVDAWGQYLTFANQLLSDGTEVCMVDPYSYDDIIWFNNPAAGGFPNPTSYTIDPNTGNPSPTTIGGLHTAYNPTTGIQVNGTLAGMTPRWYPSIVRRFKSAYYCLYLMIVDTDNHRMYYDDNTGQWIEPQQQKWLPLSLVPLGNAIGAKTSVIISVVDAGVTLSQRVATRVFENGLAYVCLANDRVAAHYGDGAAVTVTLPAPPTGKHYYRLHGDATGTLDSTPSTTVTLGRIEGAVFIAA